ncbi:hypothetical protein [Legionella saoudiensis]|uniref:hypothetical protein n=1 Tax=Legionella saoudiensis TaxID=1750561 RepID=UPI000731B4F3|nr:hypothetical protein [Legionella saoudiensis]
MSEKFGGFFNKGPMAGKQRLFHLLENADSGITTAEFDTFPLSHEDVTRLAKIIRENTSLKAISLIDCNLSSEDLEELAMAVLSNSTLQKFQVELFYDCSKTLRDLMTTVDSHLKNNINMMHKLDMPEQIMKAICV